MVGGHDKHKIRRNTHWALNFEGCASFGYVSDRAINATAIEFNRPALEDTIAMCKAIYGHRY
jgi:hypothetical protein